MKHCQRHVGGESEGRKACNEFSKWVIKGVGGDLNVFFFVFYAGRGWSLGEFNTDSLYRKKE